MTPLFLHVAMPSYPHDTRDFVGELAEATNHLGIGIDPQGSWEDALARIYMIASYSLLSTSRAKAEVILANNTFTPLPLLKAISHQVISSPSKLATSVPAMLVTKKASSSTLTVQGGCNASVIES